ncbi:MAG: hypothetical protein IK020_00090 [Clostridiales bacterium]|nr:hypothetical protein [Clostridiales bacterium]
MFNNRTELCDNLVGYFNEERNMYEVQVPWLGRKVVFWLSSGDYDDDHEMDCLKKAFETVYNRRDDFLTMAKTNIREKLLPYIASHEPSDSFLPYPKVSVDDFDADYWLTDVYVLGDSCDMDEVQFNFNPEDDEERFSEISALISLHSGRIDYFVGYVLVNEDSIG